MPIFKRSLVQFIPQDWLGCCVSSVQDHWLVVWWIDARKRIQKDDGQCFDSVVILVSWMLWKERNNRTFDRCVVWFLVGFRPLEPVMSVLGRSLGHALIAV